MLMVAPGWVNAHARRQLERLDRGLVAVNQGKDDGVFLSWRLLGTEPRKLGFNVYRQIHGSAPVKLNDQPLTAGTNFVDRHPDFAKPALYFVRPIDARIEGKSCQPFKFAANPPLRDYLSIPLQTPDGYTAGDASAADLDGDGEYELVIHMAGRGRDNSQSGFTDEPVLQAYKLDGALMWSVNLGKNIREGAHYTQFIVYDLDGDGKAEMVCKTADGTVDGVGKVIGDPAADHRQQSPASRSPEPNASQSQDAGRGQLGGHRQRQRRGGPRFGCILKGPEYLTVFDGLTGAALSTVDYLPRRHPKTNNPTPEQMNEVWGDNYGNRIDRFRLAADILGDWREELIARTPDSRELRIYTTTISCPHRLPTLMHDSQYRLSIAWQNVGYNQPPHPSFFLGHAMREP
jgi:rhamnogalacturonan endolyase